MPRHSAIFSADASRRHESLGSLWKRLEDLCEEADELDETDLLLGNDIVDVLARHKEDVRDDEEVSEKETDWGHLKGDQLPTGTLFNSSPRVGRNDPCPCGSGNKYKKCCLQKKRRNPEWN